METVGGVRSEERREQALWLSEQLRAGWAKEKFVTGDTREPETLCQEGARSGQGEAGVATASVEGSSRGGLKGGVESPPQEERLGIEMQGSLWVR